MLEFVGFRDVAVQCSVGTPMTLERIQKPIGFSSTNDEHADSSSLASHRG
jgi:hypothetical protein